MVDDYNFVKVITFFLKTNFTFQIKEKDGEHYGFH